MAVVARYLVDTSAAARLQRPTVAQRLVPLIEAGLVATCAPLDYEALTSARNPREYEAIRADRRMAYEYLATQDEDWQRALDVHRQLARESRPREAGLPDLLIAAAAERHRVMLLHYDDDFDTIGRITEQEVAWVVARGSIP